MDISLAEIDAYEAFIQNFVRNLSLLVNTSSQYRFLFASKQATSPTDIPKPPNSLRVFILLANIFDFIYVYAKKHRVSKCY